MKSSIVLFICISLGSTACYDRYAGYSYGTVYASYPTPAPMARQAYMQPHHGNYNPPAYAPPAYAPPVYAPPVYPVYQPYPTYYARPSVYISPGQIHGGYPSYSAPHYNHAVTVPRHHYPQHLQPSHHHTPSHSGHHRGH